MASVHLCSAVPDPATDASVPAYAHDDLHRLRRYAGLDRFGTHTVTADPETADLVLFVERGYAPGHFMEANRHHPYTSDFPEKVFVANGRYDGVPYLPGVYGSVRSLDAWVPHRVRSGMYIEVCDYDHLTPDPDIAHRPYLFSFVGATRTWPKTRRPLLGLADHPRGLVRDTSDRRAQVEENGAPAAIADYQQRYVRRCHESKFILCPRGDCVNSMRLYEAMRMGRAPVIISDHWIAPEGPDWSSFSVRIPEGRIHEIPARLEALEGRAEQMGHRARTAWEDWFSAEVIFHRVVEWCLDLRARRVAPENLSRRLAALTVLAPFQLRRYVGTKTRSVRRRLGLTQ